MPLGLLFGSGNNAQIMNRELLAVSPDDGEPQRLNCFSLSTSTDVQHLKYCVLPEQTVWLLCFQDARRQCRSIGKPSSFFPSIQQAQKIKRLNCAT